MRWLLLIFVFTIDENGDIGERLTATRLFNSQAACDYAGENLRGQVDIPDEYKSFSICIPEDFSQFEDEGAADRQ